MQNLELRYVTAKTEMAELAHQSEMERNSMQKRHESEIKSLEEKLGQKRITPLSVSIFFCRP